jgi:glutaredoxin
VVYTNVYFPLTGYRLHDTLGPNFNGHKGSKVITLFQLFGNHSWEVESMFKSWRKGIFIVLLGLFFIGVTGCTPAKSGQPTTESSRTAQVTNQKIPVNYYYPSSDSASATQVKQQLALLGDLPIAIQAQSLTSAAGQKIAAQLTGKNAAASTDPVLTIAGQPVVGKEVINQNLFKLVSETALQNLTTKQREQWLQANQSADTYTFFYKPECPYCNAVERYWSTMAAQGTYTNKKPVIHFINVLDPKNADIVSDYYNRYNVQQNEHIVPLLFKQQGYIVGSQKIMREFNTRYGSQN